jgi:CBS domain-containing protein
MKIEQLMSRDLRTCSPNDTLDCAARMMWEKDCGVVPIVDSAERVVGVITDRDICMAAYTQGRLLTEILVSSIAMKPVVAVRPQDSAKTAEDLMRKHQVRRVLVTEDSGHLVGVLSINDLVRGAGRHPRDLSSDDIAKTLAAISQPHRTAESQATT